jgi:hypothetical protein
MLRRDSEGQHSFANTIFKQFSIFDLQGLLHERGEYTCGVEAYEVSDFEKINFQLLDKDSEKAKYQLCKSLKIPYYFIVTSKKTKYYRIYEVNNSNKMDYKVVHEIKTNDFIEWWKEKQNFQQIKPMHEAHSRIVNSQIDIDLFANQLAWGVNLDGFSLNQESQKVTAIFEKRIGKYKPPNISVEKYDPNRFFHYRGGDYPSWNILFQLSKSLQVPLYLLTFERSEREIFGATIIENVCPKKGLTYRKNIKPCENLFSNKNSDFNSFLNQLHG